MIYIFEDDERDPIPQLFMRSYDKSVSSKFVYTRGNGNIYNKVADLVNTDKIIVYLDTIPGNVETRRIYNNLLRLSRKNNRSIIVLPILGAEYYFIKSIQNENIVIHEADIRVCVNNKAYFNSPLISTADDRKYCKYYERYCKLILNKAVADCVRNSEDKGKNRYFRWYYEKDCKCEEPLDMCTDKSIVSKSQSLLAAYPCVPCNSVWGDIRQLSLSEMWDIHKELIDLHNKLCDELADNDPDTTRIKSYKYIKSIMNSD